MKSISLALLMLVACVAASPTASRIEASDLPGFITDGVDMIKLKVVNKGLDPYQLGSANVAYVWDALPDYVLSVYVDGLRFTGLSDIVVVNASYNPVTTILTWNILMPQLMVTLGDAGFELQGPGSEVVVNGRLGGMLVLNAMGISGDASVTITPSEVSVRNIRIFARWWSVESSIRLTVAGIDFSDNVNNGFAKLHELFRTYNREIDSMLRRIANALVDRFL